MSKNKITIKEVAKEAGVSVATVSYVINDRKDVKISDKTRKKVLQVINLLDYAPNQAAKALASKRKSQIGLALSKTSNLMQLAGQMQTMQTLAAFFHRKNYELMMIHPDYLEKYAQADAIICYDMETSDFKTLGDNNLVPLLALDSFINDPLFFQINSDIEKQKSACAEYFQQEPYSYVTLEPHNVERKKFLESHFDSIYFVNTPEDFKSISAKNLFLTDEILVDSLREQHRIFFSSNLAEDKLELLFQSMEQAIERAPIQNHNLYV